MTREHKRPTTRRKPRRRRRNRAAVEELRNLTAQQLNIDPRVLGGFRVYIKGGYYELQRRDDLIRSEHRKDIEAGVPKMRSMKILARMFRLSVKRVQAIIYKK